jgi:hypothetical protein
MSIGALSCAEQDAKQMDFAAAGEFWFAPAALMQMRPPSETLDPLMRSMELEHERAHWFQFAGSTIGSLILTLHRAEHVLLLANAGPGRSAHHAFRRAIAERDKVDRHISTDPQLARLGALLDFARLARTHLLHSGYTGSEPSWPLFWETVQMLATATYRVHTGSRAGATELLEFLPVEGALRALKPDVASDGLATVHLFEAGARLSEWAMPLTAGWRSDGESAGISALAHPYIADRLQYGGELYRRAFDVALKKWREPSSLEDPRAAADAICRWLPTLAACIDIGLNPRVAPIARSEEHEWQTVLPGRRFELAVAVAAHLGRPEVWPSESEYCHHRDMIASTAGLGIGELEERSFQHERFDAEFWTEARPDDELLTAMSYFDYLVWAMERMHEFRRDRPRDWAIPGLLSFASDSRGADIRIVLDPENVWSHAPLYWMGDEWGSEARLSESVGFALALDIAACSFAGQATRVAQERLRSRTCCRRSWRAMRQSSRWRSAGCLPARIGTSFAPGRSRYLLDHKMTTEAMRRWKRSKPNGRRRRLPIQRSAWKWIGVVWSRETLRLCSTASLISVVLRCPTAGLSTSSSTVMTGTLEGYGTSPR